MVGINKFLKQEKNVLTKKVALMICIYLWKWLEKNPKKDKQNWPWWSKVIKKFGLMSGYCPCCEYNYRQNDGQISYSLNCSKCLLLFLWPDGCMNEISSPYAKRLKVYSSTIQRKKYAREIWKGAEKELEKVERKASMDRKRRKLG